ncbi:MAG: ABC transporter ATP-binding protein [Deltaproteobacteria bacterium]|nr:ABC transporter ATP-binding protein [Deltaproteobacteria bacterium]
MSPLSNEAEPAIHARGLTKHFGDVHAVDNLDLTVSRGEVFGFLGPNGAGKSTAMRLMLDLIRPTSGSVSIMGFDSRKDAVEIRRHIGYLPGDLALYPALTGKQLIAYFANLRGGVDWNYVGELSERLSADLDVKISDYSTGNRQKVGLIQAFMNKPTLVMLDEPSTGLDPLVQQEFQAMLREITDEGRTVFLSSHTLSEVDRVADRVGIIRKGNLVVVETMEQLKLKAIRHVTFHFSAPIPKDTFNGVTGVEEATYDDEKVVLAFKGSMSDLVKTASRFEVINMNSAEGDLEEIFLTYYRDANAPSVSA